MDKKQFLNELEKIVDEANDKIVALVHKAQEDEGLGIMTDNPLPFADDDIFDNIVDNLATTAGWLHDRVNGINRLHKKSLTKKIRKALGYTYP